MVLRRKLRSTVRKVWKKPGLLKGTGSISRTPAIKSLGCKHLQQTLSCESCPLQGVQSANIWGLKWSQCSLCLKPIQTSSSARRTPHTIASLVTNSFPYVVEPCASRGMKVIAGSFLFAILSPYFACSRCMLFSCHALVVGTGVLRACDAQVCVVLSDWLSAQCDGQPGTWHSSGYPLLCLHAHRLDLHRVLPLMCFFWHQWPHRSC